MLLYKLKKIKYSLVFKFKFILQKHVSSHMYHCQNDLGIVFNRVLHQKAPPHGPNPYKLSITLRLLFTGDGVALGVVRMLTT